MNEKVQKQGDNPIFTVLGLMLLILGGCFAITYKNDLILSYIFLSTGLVFTAIAIVKGLLNRKSI